MKFREMYFHTVVIAVCASFLSSLAFAQRIMVPGTVTQVIPNYKTIEVTHPRQECRIVEVPVTQRKNGGDNIGSFIIGSLIGSAVGNQVSGADGAGAVGAIVGGAIANEHQKKYNSTEEIVGYRQINQCSTVYDKEIRTVVQNYTVTYNALGYTNTLSTKKEYAIGQTIDVFVDFSLKYQ